jgi:hypothetical protein
MQLDGHIGLLNVILLGFAAYLLRHRYFMVRHLHLILSVLHARVEGEEGIMTVRRATGGANEIR